MGLDLGWKVMLEDEVDDRQATAGPQHTERLGQDPHLARRQVDDAVADDDIGRPVTEGQ
jgi:hypothetical protein